MKRFCTVALAAAFGAGLPLAAAADGAQPSVAAMQYYVGKWDCLGGPLQFPPSKVLVTNIFDADGVMRTTLVGAAQNGQPAFSSTALTSYDAKNKVFVQVSLDDSGSWSVDHAAPWTGLKEIWTDIATNDNKLGRTENTRVDQNTYTVVSFEAIADTTPNFKAACKRLP